MLKLHDAHHERKSAVERWLDETPNEEPYSAAGRLPVMHTADNGRPLRPGVVWIGGVSANHGGPTDPFVRHGDSTKTTDEAMEQLHKYTWVDLVSGEVPILDIWAHVVS